ncbi:hypothetical protein Hanom_Chr10g00887811 [Helianthus anomalus]
MLLHKRSFGVLRGPEIGLFSSRVVEQEKSHGRNQINLSFMRIWSQAKYKNTT